MTKPKKMQQSLDVDAVSGATVSSKCILKAIEQAIEQAGNEEEIR